MLIDSRRTTNEWLELANELTEEEIVILEHCFADVKYGISRKKIEKLLGVDFRYNDVSEIFDRITLEKVGLDKYFMDVKVPSFTEFLDRLNKLSGNSQLKYLYDGLKLIGVSLRHWIIKAILHKPNNGMDKTTFNKIRELRGMKTIESFGMQLCGKMEVSKENFEELSYPRIAEIKYDGERCLITKEGNDVSMKSRRGKDITKQYPEIVEYISNFKDDFVLDGEVISDSFNSLQTRMHRKDLNDIHIDLVVFDILKLNDLDLTNTKLTERRIHLEGIEGLNISKGKLVSNVDELLEFYDKARKDNEEGVVTKDLDMIWTAKSRKGWYKMVPRETMDLVIVGYGYGTGKYAHDINTLSCRNNDGSITTDVSSGITDEDRDLLNELGEDLVGMIVEVKYREITETENGRSLRFPSFVKLREDKEEID